MYVCMYVCVLVCVCVCVRAMVCVRARARARVCVCVIRKTDGHDYLQPPLLTIIWKYDTPCVLTLEWVLLSLG